MSNEQLNYIRKYAQAQGAAPSSGLWDDVKEFLNKVKAKGADISQKSVNWWNNEAGESTKSLIGAGVGSALGTGLGAAVSKKGKRKTGLTAGAILGAIAGASAPHVNWKAVIDSFKNKSAVQG